MILYFAADLLWATKIKGAAEAVGVSARPVRTLEMLEARLADSPVRAMLADLDAPENALILINRLRDHRATPEQRAIRIVAFGPHVATEAFDAARRAGADRVIPRGALARGLNDWLVALNAGQIDRKGLVVEE